MALSLEVASVAQDLDLSNNQVTHYLLLRLPSGRVVKAMILEDAATLVVQEALGLSSVPVKEPEQPPAATREATVRTPPPHEVMEVALDEDGFGSL